jgi:hypothetical protein
MTAPRRDVVLLGASNLTLGFPYAVATLRDGLGPIRLLAAHGHGRSFGMDSSVFVRTLPGIVSCGLWDALEAPSTDAPPLALVTDVGNDLLYGASVETILGWVDTCVARLRDLGADVVVATLPMHGLRTLGPFRYRLFKALFYPGKGPTWGQIQRLAPALDQGLDRVARQHSTGVVTPDPAWYGVDPIHIRRGKRSEAWSALFGAWRSTEPFSAVPAPGLTASIPLWRLTAADRRVLGRPTTTLQPARTLPDGTTLSLY